MSEPNVALAAAVSKSDDAIVRYKARRYLEGADPASAPMQQLREDIAHSPIARGLLADLEMSDPTDREGMSTIYLTFRYLAEIDYPPGDDRLVPYRDHIYRWLRNLERQYDGPLFIRSKHRVHGSFHANAIYASVVLGLANDDTDELCTNLLRYQWPGGGWNCNKKPATEGPTIVHTAFGLRGLASYHSRRPSDELTRAIDAAAEVLLERQVYLKRSDGQPLRAVYTKLSYPYPRLYDFMAGLHILTRAGYVTDERCANALDLLESKLLPGEGWAMERKLFHHSKGKEGFTHAPWEAVAFGRAHLLLTLDALEILRTAGRGFANASRPCQHGAHA
jgi:hypothetical protein